MSALAVERIMPQAGIRGGHIEVYGTGLTLEGLETCRLVFGSQATRPTYHRAYPVRLRDQDHHTRRRSFRGQPI